MASLALGAAGAFLGSGFGPLGASIGWMLGSALGNALFPQHIEGPRLQDLKLHTSSYGGMTPYLYATMRVAGNVIDEQSELTEHEETSGGKGGPEVTNYTYSASFAVRLCEGPIAGITRIWANGRLIYDITGTNSVGEDLPITVYLGTEDQLPDPTLEAIHGAGNVPAYRGVAYVVFTDLLLTDFGNALPNLNFEVGTQAHVNSQIRVLYENLSESFDYGDTIDPFSVIEQWPLNSGQVRIGQVGDGTGFALSATTAVTPVQTYNATPDLDYQAVDLTPMVFPHPWAVDTGTGFTNYWPIGMYAMGDGSLIPLWLSPFSAVSSPSMTFPNVGSSDMSGDGAGNVIGISYSDLFGVEAGETVVCASLSSDSRRLLLFTAPTTFSSTVTKWYEVVGGVPKRNGTITPNLSLGAIGMPGAPRNNTRTTVNSLEPGGEYMWACVAMNTGTAGTVKVYRIDPVTLNFAQDATCGTLSPGVSTHTGTMFAMQDGYCGWAGGDALIVFTRFPEGDTLTVPLSDIVSDLSIRAGLTADQIDVSALTDPVDGYLVTQQATARDMIQPLRDAFFFDAVERDGKVVFVKRGGASVVTIPDDDLAARLDGEDPPPVLGVVRAQDVDLPAVVNVNYVNAAADYQTGTQTARRQVTNSQSEVTLDLQINMSDAKAKSVADTQLYMAQVERNRFTTYTSRKYAKYEPTDVVTAGGKKIRVTDKNEVRAGVIKIDGVESLAPVLIQAATSVPGSGFTTSPPSPPSSTTTTTALLLDIPLTSDSDEPYGFYAAAAGASSAWPGYSLMKSVDSGSSYASIASTSTPAVIGTTSDILGGFLGGNVFDESSVVTVVTTGGTLASVTEEAVLNGANEALIGDEVVQFKTASLVAANTYELSGLLRGRLGTEWAMRSHGVGERFALLPVLRVPSPLSDLNITRSYKPVTFGATAAATTAQDFTNAGAALRPYSPVLLGGGCDASGNVTLNWTRRTRIGGAWVPFNDVPLSESSEAYVVQIWNSDYTQVARIITGVTSQTTTYTAAQQVTDFGAEQQTIYFTVAQVGAVLGQQERGTATGAGLSDDDPLSPLPPYQSPTSGSTDPPPAFDALNLPLVWGNNRTFSSVAGSFGCDKIVVVQFTTPAATAPNVLGWIAAAEYGAAPAVRVACLSTVAGDFSGTALGPNSRVVGQTATVTFSVGSNSRAYPTPELAPSTTYYFNVKNDNGFGACTCMTGNCSIIVELTVPHGL